MALSQLQLTATHPAATIFHQKYGDHTYQPIYGAGCTIKPRLVLVFMNSTARNIAANQAWSGLQAPWIGFKQFWCLLQKSGLLSQELFATTQKLKPKEWKPEFAEKLYHHLAKQKIFITNLAKVTQATAQPLANRIFQDARTDFLQELKILRAKHIITFGQQVSSILLAQPIKINEYSNNDYEILKINTMSYRVYPCLYPVGRGWRNSDKVIIRIKRILRTL